MNTATLHARTPASPLLRYGVEMRNEGLRLARTPMFCIPTLVFPAVFYVLFAVVMNQGTGDGAVARAIYMLAAYGVFGMMAPGLFGIGVSVALDRERGWLTLRRALPAPPAGYLVTKFAMAMLFAALICAILGVLGSALGGVRLPAASWALVLAVDVFGVLPFCALGLFLGTRIPAQAAPAIANLIYLPMAFVSGLLIPLPALPASLRAIAPLWPSFHAAQLALAAVGQPSIGAVWVHIAVLAAFAIVFFALARVRLVRGAQ